VLNTAALLFIPEIDDKLPALLGFNEDEIITNYLVAEAVHQYEHLTRGWSTLSCDLNPAAGLKQHPDAGVQFSDFYLTNMKEEGTVTSKCQSFTPYEVHADKQNLGHRFSPSNFVTRNCLIKKITWRYTAYYPNSTLPRIGYLRIEMLYTGDVIEIEGKDSFNSNISLLCKEEYVLKGIFVITSFQMTSYVNRLRLCGSYNADNFIKAFDYYSLWDITPVAMQILKSNKTKILNDKFDYVLNV